MRAGKQPLDGDEGERRPARRRRGPRSAGRRGSTVMSGAVAQISAPKRIEPGGARHVGAQRDVADHAARPRLRRRWRRARRSRRTSRPVRRRRGRATSAGMIVAIIVSLVACSRMPRLMKQKRARSPLAHSARQSTLFDAWTSMLHAIRGGAARQQAESGGATAQKSRRRAAGFAEFDGQTVQPVSWTSCAAGTG